MKTTTHTTFWPRCRCSANSRPRPRQSCITLPDSHEIKRPDLAIYSQAHEIAEGAVPTWDSPDIVTNDWQPFRLRDEAEVKIRNLSATVPAINALVHYFVSPFGIGTERELKLTKSVSVPAGAELELIFPLDQETKNGDPRVGVHILIEHPHDDFTGNNAGSQIHDGGYTSESGRDFVVQIPVVNFSSFAQEISLSVMPTDLNVVVTPTTRLFAPFEQVMASLRIIVPASMTGTPQDPIERAATIVGRRSDGSVIDGVTRLLRIDD